MVTYEGNGGNYSYPHLMSMNKQNHSSQLSVLVLEMRLEKEDFPNSIALLLNNNTEFARASLAL
jgi:hypothetical protein